MYIALAIPALLQGHFHNRVRVLLSPAPQTARVGISASCFTNNNIALFSRSTGYLVFGCRCHIFLAPDEIAKCLCREWAVKITSHLLLICLRCPQTTLVTTQINSQS
jgi:hypothetical protein